MVVDFYRPGDTALHRLDPRVKLLLLVPAIACFFLRAPAFAELPALIAISLVIALAFGVRELWRPVRAIAPVLILVCLLTPPFNTGGRVLVKIARLPLVTTDGLLITVSMLVRFLGITLAFVAVFRSIELDHLVLGLRWFGLPYSMCLIVVIAFRYIPSLGTAWKNVLDAHKLRAGPPSARGRRRLRDEYLPVLTSVLIQAVKGIPALAMALESRGFGKSSRRTSYAELKTGRALVPDIAIGAVAAAFLIAPAFLRWPGSWLP